MTDNEVTVIISGHKMVTILKLSPVKIIYGCQTTNNHEQYNCCTIIWYTCQLTCIMGVTHLQIEKVNLMLIIKGNYFTFITHISRPMVH